MGLGHGGEQMLRHRVYPPLAAPVDRDPPIVDALADRCDPLGLKKKVIIDEGDRAVAELLEVSELVHDVLRTAGAPLPLIEDRDVTEHAGPRAPT